MDLLGAWTFPPQLSFRDAITIHVGVGVVSWDTYPSSAARFTESRTGLVIVTQLAHLIFKHTEPSSVLVIFSLLQLPSLFLGTLLIPYTSPVLLAFLASYCLYIGTLVTSIVVYRISPFHPLAGYPGPLLCKVSKIWFVWNVRDGSQHHFFKHLHEKYGDAVRVGE